MIRVRVEVERSSRSAVERGDFMKTLQEALKIGESIDTEFKSWIKVSNMRERIVSDFLKWPAFDLTDCLSIAHFSVRQRFNDTGADAPVQSNHFSR